MDPVGDKFTERSKGFVDAPSAESQPQEAAPACLHPVTNTSREWVRAIARNTAREGGRGARRAHDRYAQDRWSSVWYLGEDTAEYENGKVVSTEGSWEAGVDGALPRVVMSSDPQIADSGRSTTEARVTTCSGWWSGRIAHGSVRLLPKDVLQILEWTPFEPKMVVEKFYEHGTGLIAERALSGGKEFVEVLDVTHR